MVAGQERWQELVVMVAGQQRWQEIVMLAGLHKLQELVMGESNFFFLLSWIISKNVVDSISFIIIADPGLLQKALSDTGCVQAPVSHPTLTLNSSWSLHSEAHKKSTSATDPK